LEVLSLNPSTAGQTVVVIAPRRGPSDVGQLKTDTTAGMSYTNVISQSGVRSFASWESGMIDMTSCIAGGSGAGQNEFDINAGDGGTGANNQPAYAIRGVIPATFTVSGNSAANTARGSTIHALIVHMFVDLIDYVGGNSAQEPLGPVERARHSILWPRANSDHKDRFERPTLRRDDSRFAGAAAAGSSPSVGGTPIVVQRQNGSGSADDVRGSDVNGSARKPGWFGTS